MHENIQLEAIQFAIKEILKNNPTATNAILVEASRLTKLAESHNGGNVADFTADENFILGSILENLTK